MYLQILMHIFTLGLYFQCVISENECVFAQIRTLSEALYKNLHCKINLKTSTNWSSRYQRVNLLCCKEKKIGQAAITYQMIE